VSLLARCEQFKQHWRYIVHGGIRAGASILRGVGRAISRSFESGGLTDCGFLVTYFWYTLVSCCTRHPGDAYSKERLFEVSVTVCLCKQHI